MSGRHQICLPLTPCWSLLPSCSLRCRFVSLGLFAWATARVRPPLLLRQQLEVLVALLLAFLVVATGAHLGTLLRGAVHILEAPVADLEVAPLRIVLLLVLLLAVEGRVHVAVASVRPHGDTLAHVAEGRDHFARAGLAAVRVRQAVHIVERNVIECVNVAKMVREVGVALVQDGRVRVLPLQAMVEVLCHQAVVDWPAVHQTVVLEGMEVAMGNEVVLGDVAVSIEGVLEVPAREGALASESALGKSRERECCCCSLLSSFHYC